MRSIALRVACHRAGLGTRPVAGLVHNLRSNVREQQRLRCLHSSTADHGPGEGRLREAYQKWLAYHQQGAESSDRESVRVANEQAVNEWRWIRSHVYDVESESPKRQEAMIAAVDRIVDQHEPLAYVLGDQPFGPLSIQCAPPTLIPRPETEALTEFVARRILEHVEHCDTGDQRTVRILDLCCGTGCIALLLHLRLSQGLPPAVRASITAADIAPSAVNLARRNYAQYLSAAKQDAECIALDVVQADMFDDRDVRRLTQQQGPFDVVVCNPPYIPQAEWAVLDPSVKEWEDPRALIGDREDSANDKGGLAFYRRLSDIFARQLLLAPSSSSPDGGTFFPFVAVEVGYNQADAVHSIFARQGWTKVEKWTDPFHIERGVLAAR